MSFEVNELPSIGAERIRGLRAQLSKDGVVITITGATTSSAMHVNIDGKVDNADVPFMDMFSLIKSGPDGLPTLLGAGHAGFFSTQYDSAKGWTPAQKLSDIDPGPVDGMAAAANEYDDAIVAITRCGGVQIRANLQGKDVVIPDVMGSLSSVEGANLGEASATAGAGAPGSKAPVDLVAAGIMSDRTARVGFAVGDVIYKIDVDPELPNGYSDPLKIAGGAPLTKVTGLNLAPVSMGGMYYHFTRDNDTLNTVYEAPDGGLSTVVTHSMGPVVTGSYKFAFSATGNAAATWKTSDNKVWAMNWCGSNAKVDPVLVATDAELPDVAVNSKGAICIGYKKIASDEVEVAMKRADGDPWEYGAFPVVNVQHLAVTLDEKGPTIVMLDGKNISIATSANS